MGSEVAESQGAKVGSFPAELHQIDRAVGRMDAIDMQKFSAPFLSVRVLSSKVSIVEAKAKVYAVMGSSCTSSTVACPCRLNAIRPVAIQQLC